MNSNQPNVTIGLAVYNGAEFLTETIESILAQSYAGFELVISDNASTDQTADICARYSKSDDRIRYVRQEKNIGACANFNYLVEVAKGQYFKWAASDDLLAPNYLARCVDILDSREEFVLCHSRTVTIDPDGLELPNDIIRSSGAAEDPDLKQPEYRCAWRRFRGVLLGNGNAVFDTAVLDYYGVMRTEALRDTGLLKPYIGYEKVLMASLSLKGRIAEIQENLFAYRLHENSVSSQASASAHRQWSDPQGNAPSYPRLQYLRGYISSITNSGLTFVEQLMCFAVIGQYLLQVKKWKRVFMASVFGRGIGDGNVEILRVNAERIEQGVGETVHKRFFLDANISDASH